MSRERLRITVRGAVQGVGFRPWVQRHARDLALAGHVRNHGDRVEIEVEGDGDAPRRLYALLANAPPPQATIEDLACIALPPRAESGFRIAASVPAPPSREPPRVLPDLACCADCVADLFDPGSRYYRYPFTNCSACGPRYSILDALPYDRARTSMAVFALCAACRAAYEDPADRRFHAQPIACAACGPRLRFHAADGADAVGNDAALAAAVALVAAGGILALKGLGGYQLVVDATQPAAVARLRARKARPAKPFALMVRDLAGARTLAHFDADEAQLLASASAPIVLLPRAADAAVPKVVAPGLATLGLMLPTTPLHHLLLAALARPLVCTSGNRAAEPIAIDDDDARTRLAGIADGWLAHDRAIRRALDDGVARVIDGAPQCLRLGRGQAPLALPYAAPRTVLARGAWLKNTVALAGGGRLVVSQHLGDLDAALTHDAARAATDDLVGFHAVQASCVAVDAHPDLAHDTQGPGAGLPHIAVPHHLAHALAVMLEHDLAGPVLALTWDGQGHGVDGTAWGGECLVVARHAGIRWRRAAHLRAYALPGGDAAAREPRRALSGLLWEIPAWRVAIPAAHRLLLERGLNCPRTTSMGRLFDALAALVGYAAAQTYEGEAALRLEHAAAQCADGAPYPLPLADDVLDWVPLLAAARTDCARGVDAGRVGARFHAALAAAIVAVAQHENLTHVILSGGCFQNRLLTERACTALRAAGYVPVLARRLPPHDGAIAAGQAVAAAEGWAR